ncbi:MAG: putative sugar O-methyltransferase [Thermodesulfobacteriota bacterium]
MISISKILRQAYRDYKANQAIDLGQLERGLANRNNNADPQQQEEIIRRIIEAYHQALSIDEGSLPPAYRVGGAWREDIRRRRQDYLDSLDAGDVKALEGLFANFFRNNGVAGLWEYGYYEEIVNGGKKTRKNFVAAILSDYRVWQDLVENATLADAAPPGVGNPWGYFLENQLIMPNSLRHHYTARKVQNILQDVPRPVVAEIGGGYGGFAYHLLKWEKPCTYIGFDIPIILAMQTYYLMNAYPAKKFLLFENPEIRLTKNIIDQYDIILLPNFHLPRLADNTVDLFINTNSLSEMDYATVKEYLSQVGRTCKRYFFHENSDREVFNTGGHLEVAASQFPVPDHFKCLDKHYSPWGGGSGRQREYLYERFSSENCA